MVKHEKYRVLLAFDGLLKNVKNAIFDDDYQVGPSDVTGHMGQNDQKRHQNLHFRLESEFSDPPGF